MTHLPIKTAFDVRCHPLGVSVSTCDTCGVRDQSLCSVVDEAELQQLNKIVVGITRARGSTIFAEGDSADHIYVLTDGVVRISKILADGRRQITGFLFPGDFLGASATEHYSCSAESVVDSKLCSFSAAALAGLVERNPTLQDRMMRGTSNELDQAREHILLLGQKNAREKIASMLLDFARRQLGKLEDSATFPMPISRQDLADYLGLRIETVSRVMSELRRDEMIEESRGVIRITNIHDMMEMSANLVE